MFVNALSQKTIEALDSEARELLENAATAAGTRFCFSILNGDDAETLSQLIRSAAAYLDRDETTTAIAHSIRSALMFSRAKAAISSSTLI